LNIFTLENYSILLLFIAETLWRRELKKPVRLGALHLLI